MVCHLILALWGVSDGPFFPSSSSRSRRSKSGKMPVAASGASTPRHKAGILWGVKLESASNFLCWYKLWHTFLWKPKRNLPAHAISSHRKHPSDCQVQSSAEGMLLQTLVGCCPKRAQATWFLSHSAWNAVDKGKFSLTDVPNPASLRYPASDDLFRWLMSYPVIPSMAENWSIDHRTTYLKLTQFLCPGTRTFSDAAFRSRSSKWNPDFKTDQKESHRSAKGRTVVFFTLVTAAHLAFPMATWEPPSPVLRSNLSRHHF